MAGHYSDYGTCSMKVYRQRTFIKRKQMTMQVRLLG